MLSVAEVIHSFFAEQKNAIATYFRGATEDQLYGKCWDSNKQQKDIVQFVHLAINLDGTTLPVEIQILNRLAEETFKRDSQIRDMKQQGKDVTVVDLWEKDVYQSAKQIQLAALNNEPIGRLRNSKSDVMKLLSESHKEKGIIPIPNELASLFQALPE